MKLRFVPLCVVAACGGVRDPILTDGNGNPAGGTEFTANGECNYGQPDNLPDYSENLDEAACADGAEYNPNAVVASTYYVDRFHFDAQNQVVGEEVWYLFANEKLAETGFVDCSMYWSVKGEKLDPESVGDYMMDLSFTFVASKSTCIDDPSNDHDLVDEEGNDFVEQYHVSVSSGKVDIAIGDGAKEFGRGVGNCSHVSMVSNLWCTLF